MPLLDGCRVLDLTGAAGMSCGQLLADLGATVARVEPPGGSPARADPVIWAVLARNQQSVVVDLDVAEGRSRFAELIADADILVDEGGAELRRSGFDQPRLDELNATLVHVSITPFGAHGPKRDHAATDLVVQAASGNVAITGFADRAPLRDAGIPAWSHAGAAAAGAALLALRAARRSGTCAVVDVSAQDATSLTASFTLLSEAIGGRRVRRASAASGAAGVVACADGYVQNAVGAIGPTTRFTRRQAAWLESEGALAADVAAAIAAGDLSREMIAAVAEASTVLFATRTKAELLDAAVANGFVLAPINTAADVLASPQFEAREVWWRDGPVTMPGPFARLSPMPVVQRSTAPALDEHDAALFAPRRARSTRQVDPAPPLADVNVLDFGWVMAGPYASRFLADYGATVVKVESAAHIDLLRLLGPYYDFGTTPDNSASFGSCAAGKHSVAIDLAHADAREVVLDLVRWADVVCESFAPGAMARLGLDVESLRAVNPSVITVSSSLFGQTGPLAEMPGFGTQGAAVAGLVLPTGYRDRPPCGPYGPFTDYLAPRYQLLAVLAALDHRDRTGEGSSIDVAQAETGLQAMAVALARASVDGTTLDREANDDARMRPHGVYPCAGDDDWVAIAARDEGDWRALCAVIDRKDLADAQPPDDVDEILSSWTRSRLSVSAEGLLQRAGVPAHHVVNASTATTDAHLDARGMFVTTTYGEREVLVTSTGFDIDGIPARVGPIPRLGEHTESVLGDLLGYASDRVDALRVAGVIVGASDPLTP